MNSTRSTNARDPVCGMIVDASSPHTLYLNNSNWYFCSDHCQQQFIVRQQHRAAALSPQSPSKRRPVWGREVLVAVVAFAAVIFVAVMVRGISTEPADTSATVTGAAASQHQAVDDGRGGVIVSAEHRQQTDGNSEPKFTVSLNTHTVNLDDFDPARQVKLHAGNAVEAPATAIASVDTSSHHQNYQLSFTGPSRGQVTLSIHDVAGVAERKLPFEL